MLNCNKCGNEINQEDLFCTNCGNRIEQVCEKCGNPYNDEDKFCERCGNKLAEDVDIKFVVPNNEQRQANYKRNTVLIIAAVIVFMAAGVVGAFHYYQNKIDKTYNEQTAKSNSLVLAEQNEKNIKVMSDEKKNAPMTGIIKGNDVIVRAEASISSSVVEYLDAGRKVTVINKQKCEDQNAAIINVQAMTVTVEGKDVVLKKGQAVKIISVEGNSYKCQTEINKKMVYIYARQQEIKKIYGEVWYQVKLENNKTGWIYGDYVQTNM